MQTCKKISEFVYSVGSSDKRLELFENLFPIPDGVSYNSYLIADEKTAVLDGVDKSVEDEFFSNLDAALCGRTLDYIIVNHLEPDHGAAVRELVARYPDAELIGNAKTKPIAANFFGAETAAKMRAVADGETLSLGKTSLKFIMTPMVHWPESMMCFDEYSGILFSQDAFGSFGSVDGNVFDGENEFTPQYVDEMRRYYTNIVGKYGAQVTAVLNKASALDIKMICPVHGLILKERIGEVFALYKKWASFEAEKKGVFIAYASMYGNTKRAAFALGSVLGENGVEVVIADVSKTDVSYLVANSFKYRNIVVASPTYNGAIYPKIDSYLSDIKMLGLSNRRFSIIENGSWAPVAGKAVVEKIAQLKNCGIIGDVVTVKGATVADGEIEKLAAAIVEDLSR